MKKETVAIPMAKLASRQIRLWEQTCEPRRARGTEAAVRPSLTVSKELGSGGAELAARLAERLGWQIFDKDLVEYIAREADVRSDMVELFDEKTQNEIHTWVLTLLDRFALSTDEYFRHLIMVMTTLGRSGHSVILGRGGNFILSPERTLRLKVIAPYAMRLKEVAEKMQVDRKQAVKILERTDEERAAFIRRFFHHRTDDAIDYDLVLNMGNTQPEAAEEIVFYAMRVKFPTFAAKK